MMLSNETEAKDASIKYFPLTNVTVSVQTSEWSKYFVKI